RPSDLPSLTAPWRGTWIPITTVAWPTTTTSDVVSKRADPTDSRPRHHRPPIDGVFLAHGLTDPARPWACNGSAACRRQVDFHAEIVAHHRSGEYRAGPDIRLVRAGAHALRHVRSHFPVLVLERSEEHTSELQSRENLV